MSTIGDSHDPSRKEKAIAFLTMVAAGDVRDAYRKYIAPEFRHHNPYYHGDAASLLRGMEENAAQFPERTFEVQHALEDGDLVAVHSRVLLKPDDRGIALAHVFRFEGGAIVELWDLGEPVPENSPNEYGMF